MLRPEFLREENENALFNAGLLVLQCTNRRSEKHALRFFEGAHSLNPLRDGTCFNIALIKDNLGDTADAIDFYERTIKLTRNSQISVASYNNLIGLLMRMRLLEDAAAVCTRAIEAHPKDGNAWTSLGVLMRDEGREELSVQCFEHALLLADGVNAVALNNLGALALKRGDAVAAEQLFSRACGADPFDDSSLYSLACIFRDKGRIHEAVMMLEECVKLNPSHSQAPFLLAAITSVSPPQAPANYISDLFDHYCASYENHMLTTLRYEVPTLLCSSISKAVQALPFKAEVAARLSSGVVVDLGVGTGLCTRQLKSSGICQDASFIGCDLSEVMVADAWKQGLYSELAVADCAAFLGTLEKDSSDLVVAGDVLVYIGDVGHLFVEVCRVIADTGLFAFTVEALEGDSSQNYVLHKDLRYAHSLAYIERCAASASLKVLCVDEVVLRSQDDSSVKGFSVVLGKIL